MNKKSFTSEIKQEIVTRVKKTKEIEKFMHGFIYANGEFFKENIQLKIQDQKIFENIIKFLKKLNVSFEVKGKKRKLITLKNSLNLNLSEINFKLYESNLLSTFFAGFFYGGGNISNIKSHSYYLELNSQYFHFLEQIQNFFLLYDLNFKYKKQKNKHTIYLRAIDALTEFLSAIQAPKAYFKFYDLKIDRDMHNTINRINNLDYANLNKIAKSSINYVKLINYLYKWNLEDNFSSNELVFYRIRLENLGLSLNEISNILQNEHNIFVTKSGLNHWNIKLKKVVAKHLLSKKSK
ncbi:DNA-binding protein WhiA [Mycoplasmopsis cricetuli]|uniref:DNA-binding protein WhiA n=1 Tax=Mycoplasmopsis cricetuli TaxID=171283 RepID=UPI0012EC3DBB|nr:DNA-binding protein WhiA [Mycoplasmopsis cricetuli]